MKKILTIFLVLITLLSIVVGYVYYDSYNISPTNFQINYLEEKGIEGFENRNILFFSDLLYGDYFSEEQLTQLNKTIQLVNSDIVVFGGDLFDQEYNIISGDINTVTTFLKGIDAPLGKFFILGDHDCASQTREVLVRKILEDAGFQLIEDYLPIYNGAINHHIGFYGYSYNQTQSQNLVDDEFAIAFTHNEEIIENIRDDYKLILIGHSHEFQINKPLTDHQYNLGQNKNLYRVTSVGISNTNYRLLNDPEILVISFK